MDAGQNRGERDNDKTVNDCICVCELRSAPFCKLSGMALAKGQKLKENFMITL